MNRLPHIMCTELVQRLRARVSLELAPNLPTKELRELLDELDRRVLERHEFLAPIEAKAEQVSEEAAALESLAHRGGLA